jgi:UDP-N-acetyl-D-glucosamine dehydrogenase
VLPGREWPGGFDIRSTPLTPEALRAADCAVILTDHRVLDYDAIVAHAPLVVDTRNAVKTRHPHVFRLGAPVTKAANQT